MLVRIKLTSKDKVSEFRKCSYFKENVHLLSVVNVLFHDLKLVLVAYLFGRADYISYCKCDTYLDLIAAVLDQCS